MVSFVCRTKGANLMTNKKFKKAAMALALTACVAATPLAANAETPENAADVQAPAAVDHTEADTQEAPEAELPAEEEPEAQPAAEAAAQPAAPEATPIAVELPTAEETPEEKEETPVEVTPTEDAVVEKETPAKIAPAPAKVAPAPAKADVDTPIENPDADILIEDPDADIATMDGAENAVNDEHEAKIGDTSYGTLQGAIDGAKDGDEVVLQKDHKGNIKIAEWIKLNLNGKKIEGNVDVDLSKKQDDAATSQDGKTAVEKKVEIVGGTITGATESGVTIKDARDTNVLLKDLTIEENEGKQGGGVYIENSQNVTIDHCTIQNNKTTEVSPNTNASVDIGAGGGVFVSDKSHVTITDSEIQENTGTRGGGVYVEKDSIVEVEDSTIQGNIATDDIKNSNMNIGDGGGIYTTDSAVHVSNSTIQMNTANGSSGGGGIFGSHSTVTVVNKSTITENTAADHPRADGGGIAVTKDSTLTVTGDSKITANSAADCGGGIYAEGSSLDVKDSFIDSNTAHHGGGLYVSDANVSGEVASKLIHTVTNTEITNNTAKGTSSNPGIGGGIHVATQNLTITNSKVSGNKAPDKGSQGGGIVSYGSKDITLDNTLVTDNSADSGAGLYCLSTNGTHIVLKNNTHIDANIANAGGGLYLYSLRKDAPIQFDLLDSFICENKTNTNGGGVFAYNGVVINAKSSSISNNSATGWAGGVFAYNGVTLKANNTKFLGNTANTAGGILLWSNSSADLNNSEVSGNKATGNGGGVYVYDATCSLTASNGTVFRENTAASGGAIQNGGTLTVEDGVIISGNTATDFGGGILNNGVLTLKKGTSLVENSAGLYGGGLCSSGTVEVESGAKLYNNHAAQAGDDVYLFGKGSTLTLTKVGDDWMLDDCGHKINGWFADLLDARWDADGKQEHVINLKDYAADGLTIVENEDGSYTITILDENATLALKAAHNVTPKPTPEPNPEPTPDPDTPDTPVSPEDPTTPPVQDATPDEAETPVNPENPANPPVQDATPDTVAARPKTGVNWFTALAMALSGMALTVAGAFTSLFAKSKH